MIKRLKLITDHDLEVGYIRYIISSKELPETITHVTAKGHTISTEPRTDKYYSYLFVILSDKFDCCDYDKTYRIYLLNEITDLFRLVV